ncbi:MAG: hypothetical protein ACK5YW_12965 [Betaproteobacteria bacterium]|jgi:hypothetical protein|nr:hypothetical protein [Rhodocyclaceae bacterium]MCA3134656.1 hypothetical protein [Rhodocyclaceae bacterium]MCA3143122.1 hypothetical protein [Rhodocyclaceae bacterium]MCA3144520.1 hypothetical protein [Rhodocyclaceae bacterium]MCE2898125.1 hypothetical protein [Betaproteobacteria bacterium]
MKSLSAVAALVGIVVLAGCARLEGKAGPGTQPASDGGIFGNGRSIEENRKVGSPGSD